MGIAELRMKWLKSITEVDDRFLRMIDALYLSYSGKKEDNKVDFFVELPIEIQELLLESSAQAKAGKTKPHSEVMAKYRKKYNVAQ